MAKGSAWSIKVDTILDTSTIQKQLNDITKSIKLGVDLNVGGTNSLQGLNDTGKDLSMTFQAANMVFSDCKDAIASMVDKVMDLDAALTEMKKVSDLSGASLEAYANKLASAGEIFGRSKSEMVSSATEFLKSGFSDDEAALLASTASLYQNVADEEIDAASAAEMITSQLKAFNITAEDSVKVIDAINSVSNTQAVSSSDLANGLTVASASMSSYNNTLEQTVAMLTAGVTIFTGKSAQIGRSMNTLAANIVQNKDSLEELGITVVDTNGNLTSTYDVIDQLVDKMENMNDAEKQSIILSLSGKTQYAKVAAIISQWDVAEQSLQTSLSSAGSAMQENEAYTESLQYKTQELSAAFENMSTAVVNSGIVKALLSIATAFVKLGSTEVGSFVTKVTLLSGMSWGGLSLLGKSVLPSVMSAFGASSTAIEKFSTVLAGSLPQIMAITAAVVALVAITDKLIVTYKEQAEIVDALEDEYESLYESQDSEYQQLIARADELLGVERTRLAILEAQRVAAEETLKAEQALEYKKYHDTEEYRSMEWITPSATASEYGDTPLFTVEQDIEKVAKKVVAGTIAYKDYASSVTLVFGKYTDLYNKLKEYQSLGIQLNSDDLQLISDYERMAIFVDRVTNSEAFRIKQLLLAQGYTEEAIQLNRDYLNALKKDAEALKGATKSTTIYTKSQMEAYESTMALVDAMAKSAAMAGDGGEYDSAFKGYAEAFETIVEEADAGRIGSVAFDDALKALVSDTMYDAIQSTDSYADKMEMVKGVIEDMTPLFGDAESAGKGFADVLELTQSGSYSGSIKEIAEALQLSEASVWASINALKVWGVDVELNAQKIINDFYNIGAAIDPNSGVIDWGTFSKFLSEVQGYSEDAIAAVYDSLSAIDGIELTNVTTSEEDVADAAESVSEAADSVNEVSYEGAISNLRELKEAFDETQKAAQLLADTAGFTTNIEQEADGTSNAAGGATLVNEEGPELIQSGNRAYIAGKGKPTITNLRKGDRVFTADETKKILGSSHMGGLIGGGIAAHKDGTSDPNDQFWYGWTPPTAEAIRKRSQLNISNLGVLTPTSEAGSATASLSKDDFDAWLKERKHLLDLDLITEEEYYTELEKMYKKYFEGREEYQDEYWQYEEDIYNWRKEQEESALDATREAFENFMAEKKHLLEMGEIEEAEYYKFLGEANAKYYGGKQEFQAEDWENQEALVKWQKEQEEQRLDDLKENIDSQLAWKKHQVEMDEADESEYYALLEELNEKYFKDQIEFQDEYLSNQEEIYKYKKQATEEQEQKELDIAEKKLAVEEKLNALAKAKASMKYVYSGGQFGYSKDYDAISAAQAEVRAAEAELKDVRGYASGTTSAFGGLSLVGEHGAELRVLNTGDGIIPSSITRNLMALGSMNLGDLRNGVGTAYTFAIDNLSLPSVRNAEEFFNGLKSYALQFAGSKA